MNPNAIQFACGHCQSWLTVPSHLAGVSGPCPKCGQQITSPRESQAPAMIPGLPALPQVPPAPWENPPPSYSQPDASQAPLNASQPPYYQQPVASPVPLQPHAHMVLPQAPPAWSQPPFPQAMPTAAQGQMPWSMPGANSSANAPQQPSSPTAPPTPPSSGLPSRGQSRPMTSGGSRLSLLARQLTTTTAIAADLPEPPEAVRPQDLAPTDIPDGSRARAVGDMMVKSNLRRGSGVTTAKPSSTSLPALFSTAAVVCAIVAAAYYYREPARAYLLSLLHAKPAPSNMAEATPPKIDSQGTRTQTPTAPAPTQVAPGSVPESVPVTAKASKLPPDTLAVTAPKPPVAESAPPALAPMAAPKAIPVPDDAPAVTVTPASAAEVRPAAPAAPQQTASLMPGSSKTLVEVNVPDSTGTRSLPASIAPPNPLGSGPKLNNCPPEAKVALEGLLGFLNADSLQQRLRFMQQTEGIQEKAAEYYKSNPDGPIVVNEISYLRRDASPEVGHGSHTVFVVNSHNWAYAIPVMLEEGETGVRVDWLSFIEFKDDLLKRFFSGYLGQPARFHVAIRRTHYFNDNVPDLENKECFEITNAMGTINGHVFVPKPSPLVASLAGSITWDKASVFPIVELQWRKEPGYQWIEMTAVPQLNWYSANAKAAVSP